MDHYKNIPIIDADGPATDLSHPKDAAFGCVPRDYEEYPEAMFAQPDGMKLIEPSDWDAYYDKDEETKSSLEHVFLGGPDGKPRFVNLDQGQFGDCWCFSTGHSIMVNRLAQNLPIVRLNPSAVATMLKRPDMGGWCGLSAQFARDNGYPVEGTGPGQWPLQSHDMRYDTAESRELMTHHKITEDWVDLTKQVYNRNLTERQLATCLFNNYACPVDFNWWGHSVCALRMVRISRGEWGLLILNSWKGWGRYGLAVLRGNQRIPNGAVCVRSVTTSRL